MSTDLELLQELPKIRVSPLKIPTLQQSCNDIDDNNSSTTIQQENKSEEECWTPTSDEHKIPAVLSCPPAPRKSKKHSSCKRKLSEFEFFEMVNREEVDSFFQSSFEVLAKRRCPCK